MVIVVVSESGIARYLKMACVQVLGSPIILPSSRYLVPFTHPLAWNTGVQPQVEWGSHVALRVLGSSWGLKIWLRPCPLWLRVSSLLDTGLFFFSFHTLK